MEWEVNTYNRNAAYVSQYGEELLSLLSPQAKELILDLGCGDGTLAEKIAHSGSHVIGIDSSKAMAQAARARGVEALMVSGEEMSFDHRFDAVFSNAALHWMQAADRVIKNVYCSLKEGGRFCAEMGSLNNVKTIITALYDHLAQRGLDADLYNPWYFPSKEEYCSKLELHGFTIGYAEVFERPTPLPTNVTGWLKTFALPFLKDIPKTEHDSFIGSVASAVEDKLKNSQGQCLADYARLRFLARKC